ncbi:unnamed protein product [Paramecium octaurelia]|uniref:Uncharacterized protein n=1 Tax=Paramecium octaurelia TaxID=43137 RepID=A0A8S1SX51_PAROT|nr:unnamed protein product [Paramecium octaurelia]
MKRKFRGNQPPKYKNYLEMRSIDQNPKQRYIKFAGNLKLTESISSFQIVHSFCGWSFVFSQQSQIDLDQEINLILVNLNNQIFQKFNDRKQNQKSILIYIGLLFKIQKRKQFQDQFMDQPFKQMVDELKSHNTCQPCLNLESMHLNIKILSDQIIENLL